jgi:hypothetical protein
MTFTNITASLLSGIRERGALPLAKNVSCNTLKSRSPDQVSSHSRCPVAAVVKTGSEVTAHYLEHEAFQMARATAAV